MWTRLLHLEFDAKIRLFDCIPILSSPQTPPTINNKLHNQQLVKLLLLAPVALSLHLKMCIRFRFLMNFILQSEKFDILTYFKSIDCKYFGVKQNTKGSNQFTLSKFQQFFDYLFSLLLFFVAINFVICILCHHFPGHIVRNFRNKYAKPRVRIFSLEQNVTTFRTENLRMKILCKCQTS